MTVRRQFLPVLLAAVLCSFGHAPAVERIAGFRSDTAVHDYAGLTVKESLTAISEAVPGGYLKEERQAEPAPSARGFLGRTMENVKPAGSQGFLMAFVGLLLVAGYYGAVWSRVGRDPEPGAVMIMYRAPADLSPAVLRYTRRMGYDSRAFAAALIDLAVKGMLAIECEDGRYCIRKMDGDESKLAPEELKLFRRLFASSRELRIEAKNHQTIRAAAVDVRESLKLSCEKIYFVTNRQYFLKGLGLTALTLFATGIASASRPGNLPLFFFISFWLTGWSAGVIALLKQVLSSWKRALSARGLKGLGSIFLALFITCFSVPFLAGECFGLYLMAASATIVAPLFLIAAVAVNYLFFHLLKAPTLAGRRLMDEIEGFRRFLGATEQARFNTLSPSDRTPLLFEKFLPYALALDLEQQWAGQFSDTLASPAAADDRTGYRPAWYQTAGAFSFSGLPDALGDALAHAVSSASDAGSR